MASWAGRRKARYTAGVLAVLALLFGGVFFYFFYDAPTCSDGVQNNDELGIDCGGACERLCEIQVTQPAVLWSRAFEVVPGVYNAVAYLDSGNIDAISDSFSYTFRLFDDANILIAERSGTTRIAKTGIVPVFEGNIETGNRVPARTFFESSFGNLGWNRQREKLPQLVVSGRTLTNESISPRITATIENTSVDRAFDVEVVAVVFDSRDNAIAGSRTSLARLDGRSSSQLIFTWPEPFEAPVAKIDIIARSAPAE